MSNKKAFIVVIQIVIVIYLVFNNWHIVEETLYDSSNKVADNNKENLEPKKVKVLFIGNSYTYGNRMTETLSKLSKLQKQNNFYLDTHSYAVGGATIETHWKNRKALNIIKKDDWDYIVFQGQSTTMISSLGAKQFDFYLNKFLLKINRNKTKVILFSTWPRKENNPLYRNYEITQKEMLKRTEQRYYQIAKKYETNVVYTGSPFYKANKAGINTYEGDGSHANKTGSFIVALAFLKKFMPNSKIECPDVNMNIGIEIKKCEVIKRILYPSNKKASASN